MAEWFQACVMPVAEVSVLQIRGEDTNCEVRNTWTACCQKKKKMSG
jgi:hypothetical protein